MTEYAVWHRGSDTYPSQLDEIHSPPVALYANGRRETLNAPCVAIVGTRYPTSYGTRVVKQLSRTLAQQGVCIVSGMAVGIDGYAHQAALDAGGRTVAILGAGVDEVYPRSHASLYRNLVQHGLVLSEYPPGTKPFKGCFPRRNRIIAGLASVTIVVEAGQKSGALITATYAQEFGRTVAAVPGPIESGQSYGTNHLIRDGANVIASIEDALMLLGMTNTGTVSAPELEGDSATVWDAIVPGVCTDDIIVKTGLPADRCLAAITNLEMCGLVDCLLSGEIQRR
jgi:DNA processing protein